MAFTAYTYADRATANSYASVAEFTAYLADRLNAPTISTDAEKEKLLMAGTQRLEAEDYKGDRTYSDGRLKWPRSGLPDDDGFEFSDGVIPEKVKIALYEAAIYAKTVDITAANDELNYSRAKVGEIEVTYNNRSLSPNDTLTSAVWQNLSHFLDYRGNRVSR